MKKTALCCDCDREAATHTLRLLQPERLWVPWPSTGLGKAEDAIWCVVCASLESDRKNDERARNGWFRAPVQAVMEL